MIYKILVCFFLVLVVQLIGQTSTYYGIVTQYNVEQGSVNAGKTDYYQLSNCNADFGYPMVRLDIILPDNVEWSPSSPRILCELSTSVNDFNQTTIQATNYIWNDGIDVITFNNMTIRTQQGLDTYGLRCTSTASNADYSFEFTYIDDNSSTVSGVYDYDAFFDESRGANSLQIPGQYARIYNNQVKNLEDVFVQINFCMNNVPNPSQQWQVDITVSATADAPKSAFWIYGCPLIWGESSCTITHCEARDYDATSLEHITLVNSPSAYDLREGILIGIHGIGAELSLINSFDLCAKFIYSS